MPKAFELYPQITMLMRPYSFFIPRLSDGGAQKVIVNLANELIRLIDSPVHIVVLEAQGAFISEVRPEIKIIELGRSRALSSIISLAHYLKSEEPQFLCSSLNYANICASIAWRLACRPCKLVLREDSICRSFESFTAFHVRQLFLRILMRQCYGQADRIVAISKAVADSLLRQNICRSSQIATIGNPIVINSRALSEPLPVSAVASWGPDYICAMGRLENIKGFDILIKAFGRLKCKGVNLVLLGEGSQRAYLEGLVEDLQLKSRVFLPGFIAYSRLVVRDSRLFVLSSRFEGFGNVLVEALSTGVPIVSTDCPGGPREILNDGRLGHLVPPENVDALATAIDSALISPLASKEVRINRALEFDSKIIAQKYLDEAFS